VKGRAGVSEYNANSEGQFTQPGSGCGQAERVADETATGFKKKKNPFGVSHLQHGACHSPKPTGYEKKLKQMPCQAPQQASRAGGSRWRIRAWRLQAEYAVSSFGIGRDPGAIQTEHMYAIRRQP